MGRDKYGRRDTGRDGTGFAALPWVVLDSPAYIRLSHPARSLLIEIARQHVVGVNNGRLLASAKYLKKRGWNSSDVITRAKRELLEAGFIHQTVMGHRPNKASWYAITWQALDRHPDFDPGAAETFRRGAYAGPPVPKPKPTKEELYAKWKRSENAGVRPSAGVRRPSIAPSGGVGAASIAPSGGAITPDFAGPATPSHGNHLDVAIYGDAEQLNADR